VHGDIFGFCHINDSSEVGIKNKGHNRLFRKEDISSRAIVSTKGNVVEIKIGLLCKRRERGRGRTNWGHDKGGLARMKVEMLWCHGNQAMRRSKERKIAREGPTCLRRRIETTHRPP